jgi:putative Holliday junction resolvase
MTTILGIDLGERRIGIAIAEAYGVSARPLVTLRRGRTLAADAVAIQDLIDRHEADALVVGLPFEADSREGPQAEATRAWAAGVVPLLEHAVALTFQDERLSSHLAEQRLGPMPRGRSGGPPTRAQRESYRARVDREAAAIILQDALDTRSAPGSSSPRPPTTMETPA